MALLGAAGHALNMILVRKLGVAGEPVEVLGLVGNGLSLVALTPRHAPGLAHALAARSGPLRVRRHDRGLGLPAPGAGLPLGTGGPDRPFQYSQMLYGILAGLLVFADVPSRACWSGLAIIVLSGLYILRRERRTTGQHA